MLTTVSVFVIPPSEKDNRPYSAVKSPAVIGALLRKTDFFYGGGYISLRASCFHSCPDPLVKKRNTKLTPPDGFLKTPDLVGT